MLKIVLFDGFDPLDVVARSEVSHAGGLAADGVTSTPDLAPHLRERDPGPRAAHAPERLFAAGRRGTVRRRRGAEPKVGA